MRAAGDGDAARCASVLEAAESALQAAVVAGGDAAALVLARDDALAARDVAVANQAQYARSADALEKRLLESAKRSVRWKPSGKKPPRKTKARQILEMKTKKKSRTKKCQRLLSGLYLPAA
jgi:hypothetical protein